MGRKHIRPMQLVSFIDLSNDPDVLIELLGQADSLHDQARDELLLRKSEKKLIKEKLKVVRQQYSEPHISDHAVVRYLERVVGIDIKGCKTEMISKLPKDFVPSPLIKFVKLESNGLQYVVRDNLIISVTPTEPNHIKAVDDKETP